MLIRTLLSCLLLAAVNMPSYAQVASRYSIIIDELLPDPTPVVGLPNAEFIELKNISSVAFDLLNWNVADASGNTAVIKSSFILQPDSFVVICSSSAYPAYAAMGPAIGVSGFPSLNNDGDTIYLQSPGNNIIDAVAYNKTWFNNDSKTNGGWSIEMIDTKNPCTGFGNWKACIDPKGGTPGKKNSVDEINTDPRPPALIRTYTLDSITIVALFDKAVDSATAALTGNYQLQPNIGNPVSAVPRSPFYNEVILKLPFPLVAKTVYQLTVNNLSDCSGNEINMFNTAKAGLPDTAATAAIVINEILFNPKPGGYDYVEFYNRSNNIADLQQLSITNRDITGTLNPLKKLVASPFLFFPGDYIVVTENSKWVEQNYTVKNPGQMITITAMPSLPDDNGSVVLVNANGMVVDEIHYDHKWHFSLITDESGVALERLDPDKATQNASNWSSAASTAGFGTPTYLNSTQRRDPGSKSAVTVTPTVFSPDNDGNDDYCFINYQVADPGYVANIFIFDAAGRPVCHLAKNATLTSSGSFRWDGFDDSQRKLPVGIYVVITEIFNLQGKTKRFKNAVTIAGKL